MVQKNIPTQWNGVLTGGSVVLKFWDEFRQRSVVLVGVWSCYTGGAWSWSGSGPVTPAERGPGRGLVLLHRWSVVLVGVWSCYTGGTWYWSGSGPGRGLVLLHRWSVVLVGVWSCYTGT